ncbi:uncharacterized protein LOC144427216 [Styela clava]
MNLSGGHSCVIPYEDVQSNANGGSQKRDENDDHDPSSFASDTQFKPVLDKLPLLVEKKTGEEGGEILFKERCILFQYDKDTNQWKERGVGDIKILFNDILNMYRVVMRREQVIEMIVKWERCLVDFL